MTSSDPNRSLSDDDARVFDGLAENGLDLEAVDALQGEDRARGERIRDLMGLLDSYPVEDASEDLVNATLARVGRAEDERADRMRLDPAPRADGRLSGRRWRFPDLFATAAMLLLAVGVIVPISSHLRQSRLVAHDHDNMVEAHDGFTTYAAANDGVTPMQSVASLLPDPFHWLGRDSGRHNQLVHEACGLHTAEDDHRRPDGVAGEHPYSYQVWRPGAWAPNASQPLITNTNPLPARLDAGRQVHHRDTLLNAGCHEGTGQNVLFGDGHVEFLGTCQIEGDRLWDPGHGSEGMIIAILRGELPADHAIFLVH